MQTDASNHKSVTMTSIAIDLLYMSCNPKPCRNYQPRTSSQAPKRRCSNRSTLQPCRAHLPVPVVEAPAVPQPVVASLTSTKVIHVLALSKVKACKVAAAVAVDSGQW